MVVAPDGMAWRAREALLHGDRAGCGGRRPRPAELSKSL